MEDREREQGCDKMARWPEVLRWFDRWLEAGEAERASMLADLQTTDSQLHALLLHAIATDQEAEATHFLDTSAMLDIVRKLK